jgi:PAS domain S-box-containing protein
MTEQSHSSATPEHLKVLIIEHDQTAANLVLAELKRAGFELHADVVETLADVARQVKVHTYDVILAACHLCGWRGPDALETARQHDKNVPFIVLTKSLNDGDAIECIGNGVTDIILKHHLEQLSVAVRRALRERALNAERDGALKALAESELRFRTLVEASADAIFVHSQGKFVFANPATLKLLKADEPSQVIGTDIAERLRPDFLEATLKRAATCLRKGVPSPPMEQVVIAMDGSTLELETIAIPLKWKGVVAIEVVARDISARKQAEQTALKWQTRLQLAEKAALPIGLWEWNVTDDHLIWSDQVYEQLGYTRDTFGGTPAEFGTRVHPDDLPRVKEGLNEVLAGNPFFEVQFRVLRPDGSICWLDSRGVTIPGAIQRVIGIAIDITNLKQAEENLRRSETNYRLIVEDAPYGIYRSNFTGKFLMANPALVKILGYDSEDEVLSLDIANDVYLNPAKRASLMTQTLEAGSAISGELQWKRKDARIVTVRNNVIPLYDESGKAEAFQGFVEDVTERKVLEREFWQAQKFEAVDRLAGGVAHDFNNVLMIIGSYADLILQKKLDDENVVKYARHIQEASARAASITQQLLAFSRRQVLEPEVLNLNTIVTDLGKMLPKLLGEDIAVTTELDSSLQSVKVDHGQMEQVVMNLAVNARDAMPRGGHFTIGTTNIEVDAAFADQRPPMTPGSYVRLSVTDTGSGMDAKTKARVFEPFFTTKERGKGTGLGLATVYGIVKQSGGFIWLTSEVGQGTTFEVLFPQCSLPMAAAKACLATMASGGSETILLVDDEAALCAAGREFLVSRGYTVLVAANGPEAIRICQQHSDDIDAILTDLVLPGMDGAELATIVTSWRPRIAVLYMSGYADRSLETLGAGAVLLHKPFKLSDLESALRSALESRKCESPGFHQSPASEIAAAGGDVVRQPRNNVSSSPASGRE